MLKDLWSRLWLAREGLGAVELGFIAPVLLLMLLGILDFGMAFWQQMQIGNAADAGAQWAMTNTFNQSTITSITQHATNLSSVQVDPAPRLECGCPKADLSGIATGYGTAPGSCTTCTDGPAAGTTAKTYVVVNTKICYKTIFRWFPTVDILPYGSAGCNGVNNEVGLTAQSFVLQ